MSDPDEFCAHLGILVGGVLIFHKKKGITWYNFLLNSSHFREIILTWLYPNDWHPIKEQFGMLLR